MAKRKTQLPWSERERELEALRKQIARLEVEVARAKAAERQPVRKTTIARGMAAVRPPQPKQAEAPTPAGRPSNPTAATAPAQPAAAQETWPSGTDLAQPRTFGVKPPVGELEQGSASVEEYRRRLNQHFAFATRVLHTSGVVAVVWREWRAFERTVEEKLRQLNAGPAVA